MKCIAYYRVSTSKQGINGLGMEAQQEAVRRWCLQSGATILASYTEVESGKKADRPQLARALAHARGAKAVLVVAKLDRLARNVAFLSTLMESGLEFVACDLPQANRLTIHILAAVAEDEAKRISDRTKAALAALKGRGVKLGSQRAGAAPLTRKAILKGVEAARGVNTKAREKAYEAVRPLISELRAEGLSLEQVADRLNSLGYTTRRGKPWNKVQVMRVAG